MMISRQVMLPHTVFGSMVLLQPEYVFMSMPHVACVSNSGRIGVCKPCHCKGSTDLSGIHWQPVTWHLMGQAVTRKMSGFMALWEPSSVLMSKASIVIKGSACPGSGQNTRADPFELFLRIWEQKRWPCLLHLLWNSKVMERPPSPTLPPAAGGSTGLGNTRAEELFLHFTNCSTQENRCPGRTVDLLLKVLVWVRQSSGKLEKWPSSLLPAAVGELTKAMLEDTWCRWGKTDRLTNPAIAKVQRQAMSWSTLHPPHLWHAGAYEGFRPSVPNLQDLHNSRQQQKI